MRNWKREMVMWVAFFVGLIVVVALCANGVLK